jgi:hypothetical protein
MHRTLTDDTSDVAAAEAAWLAAWGSSDHQVRLESTTS